MASSSPPRSPPAPQAAPPKKRGRPISTDAAAHDPYTAATREYNREKKRRYRANKKQEKEEQIRRDAEAQAALAAQAASIPPEEQQEQNRVMNAIASIPPVPSSNSAPISALPDEAPAPAMFEGSRIQGFGGLPETGFPESEAVMQAAESLASLSVSEGGRRSSLLRDNNSASARAKGKARATTPVSSAARSNAKGKGKAVASTPSSASTLTAWLQPGRQREESLPHSLRSFETDLNPGFGNDEDYETIPEHINRPVLAPANATEEEEQFRRALEASRLQEEQRRIRTGEPTDDEADSEVATYDFQPPYQFHTCPLGRPSITFNVSLSM